MTYYQILGVPENASHDQIRFAYRVIIKRYHPDKNPTATAAAFTQQLNEAYDVLSDPVQRAKYDQQRYGAPPKLAEHVVDEDPRDVYRREYIQRKQREKQEEKRQQDRQRRAIFRVMRWVNFTILAYAVLLTIDYCLPTKVYQEVGVDGWQKTFGRYRGKGGVIYSFMETTHFTLTVSYELLQRYDFDANEKDPLVVSTTPICRIPTTVSLADKASTQAYRVLGSPFSEGIARPLILLIVTAIILWFRKYSYVNYMNCFMPLLLFLFVVPPWFHL